MMVHFKNNPILTIIVAYAPKDDKNDAEKDILYEDLHKCIQDVPPHNVVILVGDLNARIGYARHTTNTPAISKFTDHDKTDENNYRPVNYCGARNMRLA